MQAVHKDKVVSVAWSTSRILVESIDLETGERITDNIILPWYVFCTQSDVMVHHHYKSSPENCHAILAP